MTQYYDPNLNMAYINKISGNIVKTKCLVYIYLVSFFIKRLILMSATDLQFHQKRRFDQLGYYNLIKKLLEIQIETADGCIINF